MALINCPECNNNVSTKAESCPHCGFPLKHYVDEFSHINDKKMNMEFTIDVNDDYIQSVNGIKVDIADLLTTNGYERSKASKTLNSITKIGIVQAKNIVDDFIKQYPEFDKETEFKLFISEQSNLTELFNEDTKIDKISIDYKSKLFRLGFWSYIYKFSDIDDVTINENRRKISVIVHINHEYIPDITISVPNFKNLHHIKKLNTYIDLPFNKIILSRDEALAKAISIKELMLNLKNYNE